MVKVNYSVDKRFSFFVHNEITKLLMEFKDEFKSVYAMTFDIVLLEPGMDSSFAIRNLNGYSVFEIPMQHDKHYADEKAFFDDLRNKISIQAKIYKDF